MIKLDIIFNNLSINIYPNFDYRIDKYLNINLNKEFNIEYNKNSLFKEKLRLKTLSKRKYNLIYENNSDNIYIKKILKYYLSKTTKKNIFINNIIYNTGKRKNNKNKINNNIKKSDIFKE